MLKFGIVPDSFGHSYSVPNSKGNCSRGKSVTVDDFRAISICPIISKVFELGVLDRFKFQFGFNKEKRQLQSCCIFLGTRRQ